MKRAKLGFARLVFGELDQVAAGQNIGETGFLLGRQQGRAAELAQELFGRPFRCAQFESILQVKPDCVGNQNTKGLGLGEHCQRLIEFFPRPEVGRHGRGRRPGLGHFAPAFPQPIQNDARGRGAQGDPEPDPADGQLHRGLDVADVVDGLNCAVGGHLGGVIRGGGASRESRKNVPEWRHTVRPCAVEWNRFPRSGVGGPER